MRILIILLIMDDAILSVSDYGVIIIVLVLIFRSDCFFS